MKELKLTGLYGTDISAQLSAIGFSVDAFDKAEEARKNLWKELECGEPWIASCRNLTISGILDDKEARASYFNLCKAGLTQPEFLEWLAGMAVLARQRGKSPKWLSGLGKTRKQLSYIPKQLRDTADKIEALNKYPLLTPEVWIHGRRISERYSEDAKNPFGKLLMGLPFLLRCYAAFLTGHTKSMSRILREVSRTAPRTRFLLALISAVRRATGRPRYQDLANILTATGAVAGSDRIFDAASLKALDRRARQKEKH